MPGKPIKHLLVTKHFAEYWTRRAKVRLGLKRADYKTISIDYSSRGTIYVYFYGKQRRVVASISFWADGTEM